MATYIGIGYSQQSDWQEAAFEASVMVRKQLSSSAVNFILLLATSHYCHKEILPAIRSVLNPTLLIGTSVAAIILPDQIMTKGLAILALNSDSLSFHSDLIAINNNTNIRSAGFDLARNLTSHPGQHRQGSFLLGDGFYRNSTEFFNGTGEVLGFSSPMIAATSSHDHDIRRSVVFFNDRMLESHVIGTLLSGTNRLTIESAHAYKPLGKPRIATKTTEHVVRTIDDKPAISIYEEFLREKADDIRTDVLKPQQLYPLGFYNEVSGRYLLRNPVDILADGSIVFHGDVPMGAEVHLMITNKDACLQSAQQIAQTIKDKIGEDVPELLLIIESASRLRTLGRLAHQEIINLRETLGFTMPLFGFYSFGEVAPWNTTSGGKHIDLNNGGIILTAIN